MSQPIDNPYLHLAWVRFQRRQQSMRPLLGFDTVFLPITSRSKVGKLLEYASHALRSLALLRRRRPREVWVQTPQVPALWSALWYRWLFQRQARVVADCHNALFRPPWSRFPGLRFLLNRCDLVVVHNESVLESARRLGVAEERLLSVEDAPATFAASSANAVTPGQPPSALFPASFAADEPIGELIEAARLVPEVQFHITGNYRKRQAWLEQISLPANVTLTGYLPLEGFDELLLRSHFVVGFTRLEGVQLSVCNEAIGAGKPMLLSDTRTLRELFHPSAVFVDSSRAESIAQGVRELRARYVELQAAAAVQQKERLNQWRAKHLDELRRRLGRME